MEEGVEIAKLLKSYGYDCLNVDTGIYDFFYFACPPMYMPKGYLVELTARSMRLSLGVPLRQGKQPVCAVNPTAMREVRYALRYVWAAP